VKKKAVSIPIAPTHYTPKALIDWYAKRRFELCYMIFRDPATHGLVIIDSEGKPLTGASQ
jgi:hypothetical protein